MKSLFFGVVRLAAGLPFALSAICHAQETEPLDGTSPVVLTPTRLRQSLADVPGSVTIITADMLQSFGITSIPDALRLVPGINISQGSGNDYRISYHGTNVLVPKRMNVLIDGVSAYRPLLARVDWQDLPVNIDDIDRIEVFRGPNSASYGPNSMLAVINIITKHPKEAEGATVGGTVGSLGTADTMARFGGKFGDATNYRITVSTQKDDGFPYSSLSPLSSQDHDGARVDRLNFRSVTDIGNSESLDLQFKAVQAHNQIPYADRFEHTYPDADSTEYDLSATWNKALSANHDIKVQAYSSYHRYDQGWVTCIPEAMLLPQMFALWQVNPAYTYSLLGGHIPSGGSSQANALASQALSAIRGLGSAASVPICANANQNYLEQRSDIELQDTLVFSDTLRMVSGIGARQDKGDSQTYLGGNASNSSYRVFSNVEYRPVPRLNINAGGFLESDQITGSSFSPRLAFNLHVSDNQTLRFVLSKGTSMPDIMEQKANWTYSSTIPTPFDGSTHIQIFQSARAAGNLTSEKILSREIGYLGNFPAYGLIVDAKVYDDSLTDLISEKLQLSSFFPTNNNATHLRGEELQVNYLPDEHWMAFLAYSHLRNDDPTTLLEQTQYASNIGSIGITRKFDSGWRCSIAYYGSGADTSSETSYGREDVTVSKLFKLEQGRRLLATVNLRHLDNLVDKYYQDVGQVIQNRYEHRMQLFATAKLTF